MRTFQMNKLLCLIGIIAAQHLPMAIADGRSTGIVKGTRGGASSFSVRKLDELPSSDDPEDSGMGRKKSSVKGPSKRDCKMSLAQKGNEVEFECKTKEEDELDSDVKLKDTIDFKVTTGTRGLGVKVQYEQEVKTSDMKNETETEYEIVFDRIVEYRKNASGGEEAYDWDDEIVQVLSLQSWERFSQVTDDADGVLSYFAVSSLDGHVTFNFTVSRADQGERVTANKMKIDFSLVDFPWDSDDTYVALLSTVESKQKQIAVEYMDEEDDMLLEEDAGPGKKSKKAKDVIITFDQAQDVVGIIPFGAYTWEETAEAIPPTTPNETTTDGTAIQRLAGDGAVPATIRVVATSPPTETSEIMQARRIGFSFVGDAAISASNIYWDPEAGIGYSQSSDAGPIYSSTTFLALFSWGAVTFWMCLVAL